MRFKKRKRVRKKRLQTRQDRIMTLANAISISRIFLAIPLVLVFEDIAQGATEKIMAGICPHYHYCFNRFFGWVCGAQGGRNHKFW